MTSTKDYAIERMKEIFIEIPYGIEHSMNVLKNAELIMDSLEIPDDLKEIASISAILHDIGAIEAQRKFNSMEAKFQEIEGPPIARELLKETGLEQSTIDRICYIIGNHHSPHKIDGLDFAIQWDADLLENIAVDDIIKDQDKLKDFIDNSFKTEKGKQLAYERFYKF